MRHYPWQRLVQSGAGRVELVVVGRDIEYGDKTYAVGKAWPSVNIEHRGEARIARMYYEQHRLAPCPKWALANVPGSEKWFTVEECERALGMSVAQVEAVATNLEGAVLELGADGLTHGEGVDLGLGLLPPIDHGTDPVVGTLLEPPRTVAPSLPPSPLRPPVPPPLRPKGK